MEKTQSIALTNMANGQSGIVKAVNGGKGFVNKLESLGIRTGVKIIKKSAFVSRGPVIVMAGGTEIAMGHGMAAKIIVEANNENFTYRKS